MPVDIGAAILQAAQVINTNAARSRQLEMQERELKMREQQAARTFEMEGRRLAAQQKAQEAEQQYAQTRARLQETEARLNLLKLNEAERETAASARYNDPSIIDDAERVSAQKYAGYPTVQALHERVSELTKANTQLPSTDPAFIKNNSDITEALREIQYRGRYIGQAAGAALMQGQEMTPAARSAQAQAGEAVSIVNKAMGAPTPGTPPAGGVGTAMAITPIGDLVVEGKRIVDAYRAGQMTQPLAIQKMRTVLGRTAPHQAGPYWASNKPLFAGMLNALSQ